MKPVCTAVSGLIISMLCFSCAGGAQPGIGRAA